MPEFVCPQCGLRFPMGNQAVPVCPACRAVDADQKQCWRCKRTFVSFDGEGITCERCKTFWAVCSSPRL
jgi:DNA-directed RNA polymerase subunit RPC12/RpoP